MYDFIEMQIDTLKIFYQKDIIEKHLKKIIRKTIGSFKAIKDLKVIYREMRTKK